MTKRDLHVKAVAREYVNTLLADLDCDEAEKALLDEIARAKVALDVLREEARLVRAIRRTRKRLASEMTAYVQVNTQLQSGGSIRQAAREVDKKRRLDALKEKQRGEVMTHPGDAAELADKIEREQKHLAEKIDEAKAESGDKLREKHRKVSGKLGTAHAKPSNRTGRRKG